MRKHDFLCALPHAGKSYRRTGPEFLGAEDMANAIGREIVAKLAVPGTDKALSTPPVAVNDWNSKEEAFACHNK